MHMHVCPCAHAPDKENWDPLTEKQLHSAKKEKTSTGNL